MDYSKKQKLINMIMQQIKDKQAELDKLAAELRKIIQS